jgi:hypothetical protein
MEYKESNMKKWWKKYWIDCTIMATLLALCVTLGMCGRMRTVDVFAHSHDTYMAGSKENCPKWEIDPPIPCIEAPNVFDADMENVYWLSHRELFQICEDGTGVGWHWNGTDPPYKRASWNMMFSYDAKNTDIRIKCLVRGDADACDKFGEIITEIVDCWEREGV